MKRGQQAVEVGRQCVKSEEDCIAEAQARLAHELHGSVAQDLAAIQMRMSVWPYLVGDDPEKAAVEIQSLKAAVEASSRLLKQLIYVLRPAPDDEGDFCAALRTFVDGFAEQTQLRARVEIAGEGTPLPETVQKVLWRTIREVLHNIVRHASARSVTVALDLCAAEGVRLVITDDGRGFDASILDNPSVRPCLGLKGLRNRLLSLGGTFQVDTYPGRGTELRVSLPGVSMP